MTTIQPFQLILSDQGTRHKGSIGKSRVLPYALTNEI